MAITSSSTQAQIIAQYLDNIGYDHSASTSSCQSFIQACRALLVMHPSDWMHSGHRTTFNPELWERQQTAAEAWLNANSTTAGQNSVKHLSIGDFR